MPDGHTLDLKEQYRGACVRRDRLIAARDRTALELEQRLCAAGFSPEVVKVIVEDAQESGLVDDERFTRSYVNGKLRRGWGQKRIERELQRFGVYLEQFEGYPDAYFGGADELERACSLLERYHTRAKNQREARFRHLLSKGFSAEICQKAILQLTIFDA